MDPEHELAIKISEYFEFLWDGRLPVWALEHSEIVVTFGALLPSDLNRRWPESEFSLALASDPEDSFRHAVFSGNQQAVTEHIRSFLAVPEFRKPRLRRAAKTAGLWMNANLDMGQGEIADRYVPPVNENGNRFLSTARYFDSGGARDEEEVLSRIAAQTSKLIAGDLVALAELCASHPIAHLYPDSQAFAVAEGGDQSPSIASLQYDLTCHFFRFPEHMSTIAEALRYAPSFAARVAEALLTAAPDQSLNWLDRILDGPLYFLAARLFSSDNELMGIRIGAAIRRRKAVTGSDIVEAAIAEVDPHALDSYTRHHQIERLEATGTDRAFAMSMYLLAAKPWCVKIADALKIPVPFGVLLAEELDHIDRCRAQRAEPGELVAGAGIIPHA